MKRIALLFLALCVYQPAFATAEDEDFVVKLVARKPTAKDPNKFMLDINGSTNIGYKEIDAFRECITDITIINPILYDLTPAQKAKAVKDFLLLTETSSVKELEDILTTMACGLYEGKGTVTLTTPTDVGLAYLVQGPLTECLSKQLDERNFTKVVGARRPLFKRELTAVEKEAELKAMYCPSDVKRVKDDEIDDGSPAEE